MRLPWSPHRSPSTPPPQQRRGANYERETAQSPAPSRLSSPEVTALRVRALQGDPLHDIRDTTREWVFRSLLIGKHLEEWTELAGITEPIELERALEQVRRWYQQRLARYAREQVQHSSRTHLV